MPRQELPKRGQPLRTIAWDDPRWRAIPVMAEVDVLVAGGGPAGVAAAVCAARLGARTMLIERYGHLGGLATGGLVLVWDDCDDGEKRTVGGITIEILDALRATGAAVLPPEQDQHKPSQELWDKWSRWGFRDWVVNRPHPRPIVYAAVVEPEALKFLYHQMLLEAGVRLQLHTQVVGTLMEADRIGALVLESKSGPEAITAKVFIDATGDGDVLWHAGSDFVESKYHLTVVHRFANVDTAKTVSFEREHPEKMRELDKHVQRIYGSTWEHWWMYTAQPGVVWCNCPQLVNGDGLDVQTLTYVEGESRRRIFEAWRFIRANVPGFENAYIMDTAPQVGVRQTRLLKGVYQVTMDDLRTQRCFEDTIGRARDYYIPYRSLLPTRPWNLLVAGRCYSAEPVAQRVSREIPHCVVTGQAVGTAAALACAGDLAVACVPIPDLQRALLKQGVIL